MYLRNVDCVWTVQRVYHSRPQRPCHFRSVPRIMTSGHVQHWKYAIHILPVTLGMLRIKSDKSDWFQSHSIVFAKPIRTGISLHLSRGRDSCCWPKGAWPLGARMCVYTFILGSLSNIHTQFVHHIHTQLIKILRTVLMDDYLVLTLTLFDQSIILHSALWIQLHW